MITATQCEGYTCYKVHLEDEISRVRIHFHTPGSLRDPYMRQLSIEAHEIGPVFDANEVVRGDEKDCDREF
ncbi:MAG: hypothetical protein XU15_C0026G0010 [candidate division NC10 bacterium CSP1-5]|nr:MAG: hypothetical protein XU15_C0026G0010 [candidate division NC10 bacterium CSP1-5]